MAKRDLLLEIGTEELPPKALNRLSSALESAMLKGLQAEQLNPEGFQRFATPRRLAVLLKGLEERQPDKSIRRFGPAVSAAFDKAGNPTKAAEGFARSCGTTVDALDSEDKDGVAKLVYVADEKGKTVKELLPGIVYKSLQELPVPKRMRWGSSREEFVRPVHWVVILFGDEPLALNVLGVDSSHVTYGHRFHRNEPMVIHAAADYEELLEESGGVIPDFRKRRDMIRQLVEEEGKKAGATTIIDDDLLEEVTGLVEYPVALTGHFDPDFLSVPAEALILTMKSHQKCFYMVDSQGDLLPNFVTVSNLISKDPNQVILGNERVIRPRLADARFFYETDKQLSLEARSERLKDIVFQEQLGSLFDKTQRVARLAGEIARHVGADVEHCQRAALLSKCDLVTYMVGEFADLQGLMGTYYARHDGEPEAVALAITEQYLPRYAGDALPVSLPGTVLAIADKLDTIVGIFAIGQAPTGSKDPFALRRAAIGVLRILVEKELELDLRDLLDFAAGGFVQVEAGDSTVVTVFEFMLDRFRTWYVEEGIAPEVFQSVIALRPQSPLDFHRRINAVSRFTELPQATALAAANKRVSNLLAKEQGIELPEISDSLLQDDAELQLYSAVKAKELEVAPYLEAGDYESALKGLASLKENVDRFFDEVLVMSDDAVLRNNRLALLEKLRNLFLQMADISCLHQS